MVDAPSQGKWPTEPTTLFVFNYYPTNGINEAPTYNSNLLSNYETALESAKEYIKSQGNEGVCVINPITATIVFPFIPWKDF